MISRMLRPLRRHRHASWALVDEALVSSTTFLTGILLVRNVGMEGFGRYSLIWMAVLFSSALHVSLILGPMLTIGPKQDSREVAPYYGAVLVHHLSFSVVLSGILLPGAWLLGRAFPGWGIEGLALPLALAAAMYLSHDFFRRYCYARGRVVTALMIDLVRCTTQLGALFLVFREATPGIQPILWVICCSSAAGVALGVIVVERPTFDQTSLLRVTRRHWRIAKWLSASVLLRWNTSNLFILAAGAILGPVSVGAIKAAQTIMGICNVLFRAFENVVLPEAARRFKQYGVHVLKAYIGRVTLFGGLLTGSIALVAASFAPNWLRLAYGTEWVVYAPLLRWSALTYCVLFFACPLGAALHALERTRGLFIANVWATTFAMITVYPIIAWWGVTGVMFGLLCIHVIIQVVLLVSYLNTSREIHNRSDRTEIGRTSQPEVLNPY